MGREISRVSIVQTGADSTGGGFKMECVSLISQAAREAGCRGGKEGQVRGREGGVRDVEVLESEKCVRENGAKSCNAVCRKVNVYRVTNPGAKCKQCQASGDSAPTERILGVGEGCAGVVQIGTGS